ncbi:MAG: hypothetical protein ABTS22_15320 [Accumulibacter sp.]|uniref:hypothetical protein n=1 Tax=Accumulibacter sp. TaxID=2053492 RepID=UPI003314B630
MATRSKPVPQAGSINIVAKALGQEADILNTKSHAWTLIADLIDDNPHSNRRDSRVLCARLGVAAMIVDTIERRESDQLLESDEFAAVSVLTAIKPLQSLLESIERRCRRGIEAQKESLEWSDSRL